MTLHLRTFSHLGKDRRLPSEYELTSTKLLYYPTHGGFEIDSPLAPRYARHQKESAFTCADWEAFKDPREMTYARYVAARKQSEECVDGILRYMEAHSFDQTLSAAWVDELETWLPVLRYPLHGLQMVAAYVGQMAPSSRIVLPCLFQTADELRRIQTVAYRMRMLMDVKPGFGSRSQADWQAGERWQPLRKLVEELLVTWDFGEAFVALCLAVKPAFDQLFMNDYADRARESGDYPLAEILFTLREDCSWHAEWSEQLATLVVTQNPEAQAAIDAWRSDWVARTAEALTPLRQSLS